jgi:hypothetical protein
MSPSHRLFARIRGSVAWRHDHTASCKPIETGQRPLGGLDARFIETRSTGFAALLPTKIATKVLDRDNSSANLAFPLALLQHSPRYRAFE